MVPLRIERSQFCMEGNLKLCSQSLIYQYYQYAAVAMASSLTGHMFPSLSHSLLMSSLFSSSPHPSPVLNLSSRFSSFQVNYSLFSSPHPGPVLNLSSRFSSFQVNYSLFSSPHPSPVLNLSSRFSSFQVNYSLFSSPHPSPVLNLSSRF